MASLFKKSTKAVITLGISLSKRNWESGEEIEGKLVFRKDQPIKFSAARIRLVGTEVILITDSFDVPENKRTKTKTCLDSNYINLASGKLKEQPGDTTYPFKVRIPENTVPTMESANGFAKIRYQLVGDIVFPGSSSANVTTSCPIYIHRPNSTELPSSFVEKKERVLHKDSLLLRCTPSKYQYVAGDSVSLDLSIQNNTKKDIVRLIVGLERCLKFGKRTDETYEYQMEITKPKLPIEPGTKYEEMLSFDIPPQLSATVKGQSISVAYHFVFRSEYGTGGEWVVKMPTQIRSANFPEKKDQEIVHHEEPEILVPHREAPPIPIVPEVPHRPAPAVPVGEPPINLQKSPEIPERSTSPQPPMVHQPLVAGPPHTFPHAVSQLPMPYGHPSYYGASTFYKPPTYTVTVSEPQAVQQA